MGKVLLVVLVLGVLVYGLLWALERRRVGLPVLKRRGPQAPPPRAVGPDDDEDFLRELERRRREREQGTDAAE